MQQPYELTSFTIFMPDTLHREVAICWFPKLSSEEEQKQQHRPEQIHSGLKDIFKKADKGETEVL